MKIRLYLSIILLLFVVGNSNAQIFNKLKEKAFQITKERVGKRLIKKLTKEAITTSFNDCDTENVLNPNELIPENEIDLCKVGKFENSYALSPGYYSINLKSFCIKAGTYAPSKGDGYLYAPLEGPKKEIVESIVKNWRLHKEVPQRDVQSLLWAIIAKTKFNKMPSKMKATALLLLSNSDVKILTKLGLDFVNLENIQRVIGDFPKPIQMVLDAENKIRQLFSTNSYSYEALESLAMLAGFSTVPSKILRGTWGLHPKGYYVCYFPRGYQNITVKIYVPKTIEEVYYTPSDDVAVPAATSSQRLAISDVLNCN